MFFIRLLEIARKAHVILKQKKNAIIYEVIKKMMKTVSNQLQNH